MRSVGFSDGGMRDRDIIFRDQTNSWWRSAVPKPGD